MPGPTKHALVAGLLLATGCPTKVDDQPRNEASGQESPEEFRRRAHEKALQIALPLAEAALVLDDPAGAAQLGLGELAPEPIAADALARLRKAQEEAWREVEQIDGAWLAADSAAALSVVRFGLARMARRLDRQGPTRFDLGWTVAAAERFVAEAERRLAHDQGGCAAGLRALADALATAGRELGASSLESLKAAHEDLQSIRVRLLRFPDLTSTPDEALSEATQTAVAAVDALAELTDARIAGLATGKAGSWGEPVVPAHDQATLVRLPAPIGRAELHRRLLAEESVLGQAEQLFGRAAAFLTALDGLARRAGAKTASPRGPATPVDRARCEAVAKRVAEWAERMPDVEVSVNCDAVLRAIGGSPLDDADLVIRIVGSEVVEPIRRAARRKAPRPRSLVWGRIAPASHRHAATLGILAGMGEKEALGRAVGHARDDLCLAAAAVWFHAELGDEDGLRSRLAPHCDSRPISAWTALAAARPRRALAGLALGWFNPGGDPNELEGLWWGPLGMPQLIAEATTKPSSKGVNVTIEKLEPPGKDG